jgi:hypothetical protein
VKTPSALLVLFAAGVVALLRRRRDFGMLNIVFIALPIVMFAGLAIASGINIGIRHILTVASVYPHTLTYFNRAAGGPQNGLAFLADSNLDWGQHLKALKEWMDRTGVTRVNLAYFGQADPAYYGIECTYLPGSDWLTPRVTARPQLPGFVAISATILSGVYLAPEWPESSPWQIEQHNL